MKPAFLKMITLLVFSSILIQPVYADSLGTLFTSAKDRQKLEKVRKYKEPKKIEKVEIVEEEIDIEEEPVVKKELIIRDPVALKGIVHRNGGKSTAWVNEGNTFEGNLDSEFIQVPSSEITSDQITVIMSDDDSKFTLKVGDVFTPNPIEKEFVETVNTEIE